MFFVYLLPHVGITIDMLVLCYIHSRALMSFYGYSRLKAVQFEGVGKLPDVVARMRLINGNTQSRSLCCLDFQVTALICKFCCKQSSTDHHGIH